MRKTFSANRRWLWFLPEEGEHPLSPHALWVWPYYEPLSVSVLISNVRLFSVHELQEWRAKHEVD